MGPQDSLLVALAAAWLLVVGIGAARLARRALAVRRRADVLRRHLETETARLAADAARLRARGAATRDLAEAAREREASLRGALLAVDVLRRSWHDALAPLDLLRGRS